MQSAGFISCVGDVYKTVPTFKRNKGRGRAIVQINSLSGSDIWKNMYSRTPTEKETLLRGSSEDPLF